MFEITEWLGFGPSDLRAQLIGRDSDMHVLEQALSEVTTNHEARIVSIIGAPGVGKSRLVHDFLSKIHSTAGSTLRSFMGNAADVRDSYGIFGRVLRARFGLVDGIGDDVACSRVRSEVASVLGDRKVNDVAYFLGQLIGLKFADSPLTRAVADDALELRLLRRTVLRSFLEADSSRGPICLVFDDLHKAQGESIALLEFLLSNVNGPVLFMCVARQEIETTKDGWRTIRNDRHRVIDLAPLDPDNAARMMNSLLAPCGDVPERLVDAACHLAGGNPLLLEQMVRIFLDTGVLEEEDDPDVEVSYSDGKVWKVHIEKLETVRLPLTVEDAVQSRVAALAPPFRHLLEQAATVGTVFWLGALLVMGRIDVDAPELWSAHDATDYCRIKETLRELIARGHVLHIPDSSFPNDEEYVFRNNLERECISKATSPKTARKYHRAVADWLGQQHSARSDEDFAAMLASHLEAAGNRRDAAMAYLEAGDVARSRYAPAKALEYYSRGLSLLGEEECGRQIDAYHHQGDVCQQLGKTDEALVSFRKMLSMSFRLNMRAKGGAAHNRIGRLRRDTGMLDEAFRHLGTGLALFEACGDERGVASSLDDIGKLHWLRGDYPRALDQMRRALTMRRRVGDRRSIALSYNNLGLVFQDSGQFKEALESFSQALRVRQEIGDMIGTITTLNNLGSVALDQGDHDRALRVFVDALAVARDVGDRNKVASVLVNLGEAQVSTGRLAEAIASLTEATTICEDIHDRIGLAEALRCLGLAYMRTGDRADHAKARDAVSRSVDILASVQSKVHQGAALRTLAQITASDASGAEQASKAIDFFRRSISIFEETGNDVELAKSLVSYADFLDGAGDYASDRSTRVGTVAETTAIGESNAETVCVATGTSPQKYVPVRLTSNSPEDPRRMRERANSIFRRMKTIVQRDSGSPPIE